MNIKSIINDLCDQLLTVNKSCNALTSYVLTGAEEEEEEGTAQDGADTEQKADEESEETKKTCPGCGEETTKTCLCRSESSASSEDSVVSPDKVRQALHHTSHLSQNTVLKCLCLLPSSRW